MNDQLFVYATAGVIVAIGLWHVARRTFDPFAPLWMFLVGYFHVYVIQAIAYRDYALRARGAEVVTGANARALWALLWFLLVYESGLGRRLAARLPRAPLVWSNGLALGVAPLLFVWGLVCSGFALYGDTGPRDLSAEENLLHQFPIMMLASSVLLIATGSQRARPRPLLVWIGLAIAAAYMMIWMFNGKRSHSVIGLMVGVCAYYVGKGKRPALPVLAATAFAGAVVVSLAIGWRSNAHYEHTIGGFVAYLGDFRVATIPAALHLQDPSPDDIDREPISYETEEYGGYLLMMATVPGQAEYDYGENYLRLYSTYIPRVIWPDKPYYGRDKWIQAWIAGSEFPRETYFTGPAISVLGATQLNGGAWGTAIVLAILALLTRTAYEYFRLWSFTPWAQAWWALTYYNAWLMAVNDDPFVWFYYIYGHAILPPMVFFWLFNRLAGGRWQWAAASEGEMDR